MIIEIILPKQPGLLIVFPILVSLPSHPAVADRINPE
jgi:hypothetical protein